MEKPHEIPIYVLQHVAEVTSIANSLAADTGASKDAALHAATRIVTTHMLVQSPGVDTSAIAHAITDVAEALVEPKK